jgi:formylmethanofuran dehydrogenase subunit C
MKVTLKLKEAISIPVEADSVIPDDLPKDKKKISSISVWYGNEEVELGSLFDIDVEDGSKIGQFLKRKSDPSSVNQHIKIVFEGSVPRVKRIGEGMSTGEIEINGDVDMHCGAMMKDGEITVRGNADAWAGREMIGGKLIIEGNAGDYLGSAYRGEMVGMKGGEIIVNGDAGDYVGEHMKDGEITVKGNAGILAGLGMTGGKITIEGDATLPGGEMMNGTIIVKGKVLEMLPSFRYEGNEKLDGVEFKKYTGDLAMRGKGKGTLYVREGGE